jgi:hypothetical protein
MLRRHIVRAEWTEADKAEAEAQAVETDNFTGLYIYQSLDDIKIGDQVTMVLDGDQPRRCLNCRGKKANVICIEKTYEPHPRMKGNITVHVLEANFCERSENCYVYLSEIRRFKEWNHRIANHYQHRTAVNNTLKIGFRAIGYADYNENRLPAVGDQVIVLPIIDREELEGCLTRCRSRPGYIDFFSEENVLSTTERTIHVMFDYPCTDDETAICPLEPESVAIYSCVFHAAELMYREWYMGPADDVDQDNQLTYDEDSLSFR